MVFNAIDLFSGMGGLTQGMHDAGFKTVAAVELNKHASEAYELNHKDTQVLNEDIRKLNKEDLVLEANGVIHLLAGCPPCQGFSSIRRLNKATPVSDDRNSLIDEYIRLIGEIRPLTIMMENVPGLLSYDRFTKALEQLDEWKYNVDVDIVNVKDYGVPQNRRRLVLVGSKLGEIKIARPDKVEKVTVRQAIGNLPTPKDSEDSLHKIFPSHTNAIKDLIANVPINGGSRKDLPEKFWLECHKKENVGFNDVYGRLRWDDYSTTITGGCLNPSKGRFLHPEQNRCISAREAALLQSFPEDYIIPESIPRSAIALLIGNALPPKFSYYQSLAIKEHLEKHLG